jgi:DNA-binding transcriptional ArsR family regulator
MILLGNVSALADKVTACPSSSAELCLALWASRAIEPEPLAHASHRLIARLPEHTREQMRALDHALPEWPLRALGAMYDAALDVEAALAALRRNSRELEIVLVPHHASGEARGGSAAPDAPSPSDLAAAILDIVGSFWERCFAHVWDIQRATLDDIARAVTAQLANGPAAALERLTPRARTQRSHDALFLASSQQSGMVDCSALDQLEVLPSLWMRRGAVVVNASTRIGLCVHARSRQGTESLDASCLVQLMNVLGDAQRFEIVRLCNSRPRSTQELSRLLGITPAPVSRHLRQLKEVDLVLGRRVGRFVFYETIPETLSLVTGRLDALSREVVDEPDKVAYLDAYRVAEEARGVAGG